MNKKIIILSIIAFFILQLNSFGKYSYSKRINAYQLFLKTIDYNYKNAEANINEDINESASSNNLNYILKKENTNKSNKKEPEIVQIIK